MSAASLDARQLSTVRRRLLTWFDRHRRDLPWRRDRDPYRIWVSEVMLQQTTVATVKNRFERFLQTFPTIHALAAANEQQVLRCWEGLGYYRRARHLHRAARLLIEHHDGQLPDEPAVWEQLPGVGRYILGAVLSQAFDRRLPIVEANSLRVLCRLFGQLENPTLPAVKKWLWQTAEAILPSKRVGDFNQALMELGALCCTPADPNCAECPIRGFCISHRDELQDRIPAKSALPKTVQVREVALVIRRGAKVLLVQRPDEGRWSNMWEFPHVELDSTESIDDAAGRLLERLGVSAKLGSQIMTIRHAVTRFRISMECLEATYRSGTLGNTGYSKASWLEPSELNGYPVSTPQRKLANEIARSSRQAATVLKYSSRSARCRSTHLAPRDAKLLISLREMNGRSILMISWIRTLSLTCLMSILLFGCDGPEGVRSGERAPALSGEDAEGRPISLSQFQGKVVLVDFWATWCGPCINEIPNEINLHQKYNGRPFAILGVSRDHTREELKGFLQSTRLPWPNIFDAGASISKQWGVKGLPTFVLVDHEGFIRGRWEGGGQSNRIEAEIAKWVAEAEKQKRQANSTRRPSSDER